LNLPRSTVRSRLAKGWRPSAADVQQAEEQSKISSPPSPVPSPLPSPPLAKPRQSFATPRLVGAAMLAIAAFGIAGLALAINQQYGASSGEPTLTAWTFRGLAIAVDLLALKMAPAAVGLWRSKQRGLAIATWATWVTTVFLATLATLGFFQKNLAE